MAGLFTREALEAYSAITHPALELSRPGKPLFGRLDKAAVGLASTIGAEAAKLPQAEALHFITSLYPALLEQRQRSRLGAFYTPPCLADRLLDLAAEHGADWTTVRLLDPAAGAGAFLIHAAQRMRAAQPQLAALALLDDLEGRLCGFELDPIAADLAQAALEIVLSDLARQAGRPLARLLHVRDTLCARPEPKFDLVIGNPPYGRVTLSREQRETFGRSLYGHANLYGVFTDLALRWTKPAGLIAYLTPTSFLAGQYYRALRRLLAENAPPVAIDFVHARRGVFEDVLQETLLAVYARGAPAGRAQIHYLNVQNECAAELVRNGTVGLPEDSGAPWLAPRSPGHSELIARAEHMAARLRDYGYGVSTGPLVWNRYKDQLRSSAHGPGVHPLIWAESVTADGRFVFRASKRNHAPYFKLGNSDGWLRVEQPCVLVQRTTAKEQPRRLIAAELPAGFVKQNGGVVVENHLNMVRALDRPAVPAAVVAALLNSPVVDEVFRCMNGSVAVSAFELEALPLPDAASLGRLAELVAEGASRDVVAAECARLYGCPSA